MSTGTFQKLPSSFYLTIVCKRCKDEFVQNTLWEINEKKNGGNAYLTIDSISLPEGWTQDIERDGSIAFRCPKHRRKNKDVS